MNLATLDSDYCYDADDDDCLDNYEPDLYSDRPRDSLMSPRSFVKLLNICDQRLGVDMEGNISDPNLFDEYDITDPNPPQLGSAKSPILVETVQEASMEMIKVVSDSEIEGAAMDHESQLVAQFKSNYASHSDIIYDLAKPGELDGTVHVADSHTDDCGPVSQSTIYENDEAQMTAIEFIVESDSDLEANRLISEIPLSGITSGTYSHGRPCRLSSSQLSNETATSQSFIQPIQGPTVTHAPTTEMAQNPSRDARQTSSRLVFQALSTNLKVSEETKIIKPVELLLSHKHSQEFSSEDESDDKENKGNKMRVIPSSSLSEFSSRLRHRRIGPGSSRVIALQNATSSLQTELTHTEKVKQKGRLEGLIRRASNIWRLDGIDSSLAIILRKMSRVANSEIVQDVRLMFSKNFDVIVGIACVLVCTGFVFVLVCSWEDSYNRDVIGLRSRIYAYFKSFIILQLSDFFRCADEVGSYAAALECLTTKHLISVFPSLGVDLNNQFFHIFILIDLYIWATVIGFIAVPLTIGLIGALLLIVGSGALVCLTTTETFLRWIVSVTKQLMLNQMDVARNIVGIVDGSDLALYSDLQ